MIERIASAKLQSLRKISIIIALGLLGLKIHCVFADEAIPEKIKICGLTQVWAVEDRTSGPTHGDDYQIARARIGFKGKPLPNIDYLILTEWGRLTYNDPVTLVDAWVNLKANSALQIKIGQTWQKFTLSGTVPIPAIPFICRPEVIDGIWLAMGRNGSYGYDKGIELSGTFKERGLPLEYIFSITTGTGLDRFEDNYYKDFTGRICFEPKSGLKIGASAFYGWSRTEINSSLGDEKKVNLPEYAYGAEISYTHKHFRFITEAVQSLYEGYLEHSGPETFGIATKKQRGWYAMLGVKPLSWIEIPVQYAWHENNYVKSDSGLETITLGLTWFFKENTLNSFKFNYLIRSAQGNYGSKPRNKIMAQVQFVF